MPGTAARDRRVGVVFVTRDRHHPHPAGNRCVLLGRGRSPGHAGKGQVSGAVPTQLGAGGAELEERTTGPGRPQPEKGPG